MRGDADLQCSAQEFRQLILQAGSFFSSFFSPRPRAMKIVRRCELWGLTDHAWSPGLAGWVGGCTQIGGGSGTFLRRPAGGCGISNPTPPDTLALYISLTPLPGHVCPSSSPRTHAHARALGERPAYIGTSVCMVGVRRL
jgi:hypothetical protein